MGDFVYRFLSDPASGGKPSDAKPVVRLSGVYASQFATTDRAAALKRMAAGFYPPDLLYSTAVADSIQKETGLTIDQVLTHYDGSYSLAATAGLVFLARNADEPSIAKAIETLEQGPREFVRRISVGAAPAATVQTAVRPGEATSSSNTATPPIEPVHTLVMREVASYLSLDDRATLAMVNRGFRSLQLYSSPEQHTLRLKRAYRYFHRILFSSFFIGSTLFWHSRLQSAIVRTLEEYSKMLQDEPMRKMTQGYVAMGRDDTIEESLERNQIMITDQIQRSREALATLSRRHSLGPDAILSVDSFADLAEKRTADLMLRSFTAIATNPVVQQALLSRGIGALGRIELMDAEQIKLAGIYSPTNLYKYYTQRATRDIANLPIAQIAEVVGVSRARSLAGNVQFGGLTSFTQYADDVPDAILSTDATEGLMRPGLAGRYYVYKRDLPSDLASKDDQAILYPKLPLTFFKPTTEVWAKKWARSPDRPLSIFAPLFEGAEGNDAPYGTIAMCQRVYDRETRSVRLRVEAYVVSRKGIAASTEDNAKLDSENDKLVTLSETVLRLFAEYNAGAERFATVPLEVNIPPEWRATTRQKFDELRDAVNAFYDYYDTMRAQELVIMAATVWETPRLDQPVVMPTSFEEIESVMLTLAPRVDEDVEGFIGRNAFRLTRALVVADYALQMGLETLVSTIPAIVDSDDSNMMFKEYLAERLQRPDAEEELGYIGNVRQRMLVMQKLDSWRYKFYRERLQRDRNELFARAVTASIDDTWQLHFPNDPESEFPTWTGLDATRFTEIDYRLLQILFFLTAYRRASHPPPTRGAITHAALLGRPDVPPEFRLRLVDMENELTAVASVYLEPEFDAIRTTPILRAKVLAGIAPSWRIPTNPFGENMAASKRSRTGDDDDGPRVKRPATNKE